MTAPMQASASEVSAPMDDTPQSSTSGPSNGPPPARTPTATTNTAMLMASAVALIGVVGAVLGLPVYYIDGEVDDLEARVVAHEDKMDVRFAEQDAKFDARFVALEDKMDVRFAEQDAKFDARFVALEDKMDVRFASSCSRTPSSTPGSWRSRIKLDVDGAGRLAEQTGAVDAALEGRIE